MLTPCAPETTGGLLPVLGHSKLNVLAVSCRYCTAQLQKTLFGVFRKNMWFVSACYSPGFTSQMKDPTCFRGFSSPPGREISAPLLHGGSCTNTKGNKSKLPHSKTETPVKSYNEWLRKSVSRLVFVLNISLWVAADHKGSSSNCHRAVQITYLQGELC